ncbi:MAG: hypothetical protein C5B52_14330 [Bacteroidetes bacterium]|nr:MAG: hypothetical protein C5B52_14330 [Bacteroidota bacterium]
MKNGIYKWILLTGLLAGSLDILAAIIQFVSVTGKSPVRIFYYIASGVFGKEAYDGGIPMVIAGFLFHYFIATIFSAFFFFIYPAIPILRKNKIVAGLAYGIFVWVIMNLAVVPVSRVNRGPFHLQQVLIGMGILMLCIGLPISLMANRYWSRNL